MRIIISFIIFIITLFPVHAQIEERAVEGYIMSLNDAGVKEPVPYATVSIFGLPDSIFIKGGASNDCGRFMIRYRTEKSAEIFIKISHLGMYEEVYALSNFKQENVDTILLRKESIVLDEIRIIGAQPQIIRKRDTTIVNTSTFKTSMDSYLNEFLSRIPGMVYNKQTGVVTYNGRQIQAIRLNGKPFFDGDMQTALQRLPTLYIDKIKIYQVHGNDDSDNRSDGLFVLDLKTKAEFNGAYLNSIGGGYGSNDKQYIKTETNYFEEDGTNLSFFAERSNKDLYNKYDGNIAYNVGVSSHQQINEQLTIAGSITYNHIKNGSYSEKYEEQYFSPNNFYSSTNNVNFNKNNQLMYRTFIDWKPNENTAFFIDLGYDYSKNHSSNKNQTLTLNKYSKSLKCDWEEIPDSVRINENDFNTQNESTSQSYQLTGKWTQQVTEKISSELTVDYSKTVNKSKDISNSSIAYYNLDSLYSSMQSAATPNDMYRIITSFSVIYEIEKNLKFQPYYVISHYKENKTRDVFSFDDKKNGLLNYIDSLSYNTQSNVTAHNIGLKVTYQSKYWNLESNIQYSPLHRGINQDYFNNRANTVIKSYDMNYDLMSSWSKNNIYLSFYCKGYTSQPELGIMQPIKNTDNPLSIYKGNPSLEKTFTHSLGSSISGISGFSARIDYEIKSNDITEHILYDSETGYREITPININGNWNIQSGIYWYKTIKLFDLSVNSRISYSKKTLSVCEISSNTMTRSTTNDFGINVRGQINYRPAWGNIELYGEPYFYQSTNSLGENKISIMNYQIGLNGVIDIFNNLQLNTDLSYLHRHGDKVDSSLKTEILWNINITYKPFKKKNLTFGFSWMDILSQKKNFVTSSTANKFYEYKTYQIPTFVLFSLKYNFEFGKKNE